SDKKDQLPLKWCLPQTHLLGADLLSSITYSERIKIETFCELGLSNIQMGVRINFKIYHKPTDFLILFYSSIS
ncbi:hypothetical protein MJ874_16370, partial [Lactiplantibacillus plantarum]|nr:hypothetical protein [Lactiplantibacillus plantarum]